MRFMLMAVLGLALPVIASPAEDYRAFMNALSGRWKAEGQMFVREKGYEAINAEIIGGLSQEDFWQFTTYIDTFRQGWREEVNGSIVGNLPRVDDNDKTSGDILKVSPVELIYRFEKWDDYDYLTVRTHIKIKNKKIEVHQEARDNNYQLRASHSFWGRWRPF